jgi:hypothetical protein
MSRNEYVNNFKVGDLVLCMGTDDDGQLSYLKVGMITFIYSRYEIRLTPLENPNNSSNSAIEENDTPELSFNCEKISRDTYNELSVILNDKKKP